ncbi:Glutamate synthase [NADPH] large chain [Myxococcus hansupus]|uniref:Glutamate synthase [NADPH] large chain n=1 Tax=Pseudomyxococcus hansupus TaxID=1297742 RepID=A0A0H4X673_9BACT|nr:Glutamate synthase [NADPH] large chain [Myxococcus hansupus]
MLSVCLAVSTAWAQDPDQKLPDVVIQGPAIAPPIPSAGQGLCVASNVWTRSLIAFPQSRDTYLDGLNGFIEEPANRQTRVTTVQRTAFDLSNNLNDGRTLSYGDFISQVVAPGCSVGGCTFNVIQNNDAFTPFVSRFRGYLNITAELAGQPVHFGFYVDDGISLVIYDRSQGYQVINQPPRIGFATWRTTNSVTFPEAGLYAVEMLYSQLGEHAALELSMRTGTFTNFQRAANQPPIINLFTSGFELIESARFFQTENGTLSFPGQPDVCQQCNRGSANAPGNGGCSSFNRCNAAALCSPCDSSLFCGEACSPCGESTPNCANINGRTQCVQCIDDGQCENGRCDLETNQCTGCNEDRDCPTGACDLETFTCVECNNDSQCSNGEVCATDIHECRECTQNSHCPQGESCSNYECSPCATNDSCAGNSCNCCPNGTQCAALTPGATPTCVECTTSSQCGAGKQCDMLNGRCVDSMPSCSTSDSCGPGCVRCPGERPFCLDGEVCVQCRNDLECGDGSFCLSGECTSCTTNRHCGPRCGTCEGDTPFCLSNGSVQGSTCVGCRDDADCGSGVCNPATRTCENTGACAVTCDEGTVCNGTACVECFADAHCPCGGTCDVASNTCSTSCADSGDCLGVEHCSAKTLECERGRRKPGTEPQGGAFCCGTTADATPAGSTTILLLLTASLMFLRNRRPAR